MHIPIILKFLPNLQIKTRPCLVRNSSVMTQNYIYKLNENTGAKRVLHLLFLVLVMGNLKKSLAMKFMCPLKTGVLDKNIKDDFQRL